MRTQAIRVTVGAYSPDRWHVSVIHDSYERGVLVDSELMWGPMYCRWERVESVTRQALAAVRRVELDRLRLPAAG